MNRSRGLWIVAIVGYLHQNTYFGWNRTPQSPDELLADMFVLVLVAIAVHGWKRHE